MDSISLSQSVSKEFGNEKTSLSELYFGDLKKRIDAITTEMIEKGNTVLDTYKVLSDAISGGMGSVWRVHHESWNTDLAMKRPQPRFFTEGGDAKKKRFIAECENWINLGLHPNIVSCYYVREIGGVPTIFSEWMDNGSLKDRIADGSLYEGTEQEVQERILDIAIQAARGLRYSHENGLIHQDMKPGNLLLSKDWEAKVADFGLAKAKSNLGDSETAQTSGYTLAYCPKEQSDGEEPQRWMDVYAWALTVLEMYAGKRLWETGAEAKEHFDEYLSKCRCAVPAAMQTILNACLTERAVGFCSFLSGMKNCFFEITGKQYRDEEKFRLISASNLNNHALSFLDLGNKKHASELWQKALECQPDNSDAFINDVFFKWKEGLISYEQTLQLLEGMPESNDKKQAIKTLVREDSGLSEIIAYDCLDPVDAGIDTDGYLWILSGGALLRYDIAKREHIQCISPKFRFRFDAMCVSSDGRYLYAAEGTGFYSGVDYQIIRIDIKENCKREPLTANWKDEETLETFRREHIMKVPDGSRCDGLWLENHDNILCVMEQSVWRGQNDDTLRTKTFLEYRLESNMTCTLSGKPQYIFPDRPETAQILARWKKGTLRDGWNGKHFSKRVIADFGETVLLSGRIKMKEAEPGERRSAVSGRDHSEKEDHEATLCQRVKNDGHSYLLSRFVSASRAAEVKKEQDEVEKLFWNSIDKKSYPEAIRYFNLYRQLPEKRDCEQAIKMEKELSSVCRRVSIHHAIEEDAARFAKFKPRIRPLQKAVNAKCARRFFPAELSDVYAPFQKTLKKLPYRYDKNGIYAEIGTKDSRIQLVLISDDHSVGYVWCDKQGALRMDFSDGTVIPAAVADRKYPPCVNFSVSPDERFFAVKPDETWKVFSEEHILGEDITAKDNRELLFSPDSRFVLWHERVDDCYHVTELMHHSRDVSVMETAKIGNIAFSEAVFSEDGFFIAQISRDGDILKTCRLSYEYEYSPANNLNSDTGSRVEKEQPVKPSRRNIFSRLFGK